MPKKDANEPVWDPEFEPLIKLLVGKKGLKVKSASEVGRKKVDYFRGRDFAKFLLLPENATRLKKKCPAALKAVIPPDPENEKEVPLPSTDKQVNALGQELVHRNFCYKAKYAPINAPTGPNASDVPKKKWPDRVARTQNQDFDPEGYYVLLYEGGSGMQHFLLGLVIAGVLLACMFPVWPVWAKIGVWYLLVLFLTFYFGVFFIRLIVYTLFWIVGFEFWIFPNLNDEYCGILETFQPLYSFEKRKDDFLTLTIRFGSLAILATAIQQIGQTTSVSDVKDFMSGNYMDLVDWGVDKLTALPDPTAGLLPSLTQLEEEAKEMDKDDAGGGAEKKPQPATEEVVTEEVADTGKSPNSGEQDVEEEVNLS